MSDHNGNVPGAKLKQNPKGVRISVSATPEKNIRVRFSQSLDTLELEPDEAALFGELVLRKAREARLLVQVPGGRKH